MRIVDIYLSNSWDFFFFKTQLFKTKFFFDPYLEYNSFIDLDIYISILSILARIITVLMSIGIIYIVYKIAKKLFNEHIALLSVFVLSFNPIFNYYSHLENFDIPIKKTKEL